MNLLTPTQFRNAIYLDFEGEGKKRDGSVPEPHMAGTFRPNQTGGGGKYTCVFFKPQWKLASNGVPSTSVDTFDSFFISLTDELKVKECDLVYWSMHEDTILKEFLSPTAFERLQPYLYNLHPPAKKYLNRHRKFGHNETAQGKTLEQCFEVMYDKRRPYPPFPLGAAEACRRIDRACGKHTKWKHFSEKQKSYVTNLVQYNQGDCSSTALIAKRLGDCINDTKKVIQIT